jgi:multidrug efflux pump subunit AcrA (membrane-fusion protein)
VFSSNGEDVAWVVTRGRPERRVLAVGRRNADQVVVTTGVSPGELVSLVDPGATPKGPK